MVLLSGLWVSARVPCRDQGAPGPSTRTTSGPAVATGLLCLSSLLTFSWTVPHRSQASWPPTQRAVSNTAGPPPPHPLGASPLSPSGPAAQASVQSGQAARGLTGPFAPKRWSRLLHGIPSSSCGFWPVLPILGKVTQGLGSLPCSLRVRTPLPPIAPGAALGPGFHCLDGVVTAVPLIARNSGRCKCGPRVPSWLWLPDPVPADPWAALSQAAGQAGGRGRERQHFSALSLWWPPGCRAPAC